MKGPLSKPTVKLTGQNGNAFAVMGLVKNALKQAGATKEHVDKYLNEATSGDYNHLLTVSMEYVNVEQGAGCWQCSGNAQLMGGVTKKEGFKMTKTVEIYFDDLKPEKQEYLLMTWDTTKNDENWGNVPLAVIEREVEEPYP